MIRKSDLRLNVRDWPPSQKIFWGGFLAVVGLRAFGVIGWSWWIVLTPVLLMLVAVAGMSLVSYLAYRREFGKYGKKDE